MARLSDGSNPNWFQQARHLSLESTLKFLRFFCGQLLGGPLQADFFEKRGGWGRRLARRGGGRDEQIERCDRQKFEPI